MPVPPKRRTSSQKKRRASHHALKAVNYALCAACGSQALPHRVCPKCGEYKKAKKQTSA